jgi:hypothetical protein
VVEMKNMILKKQSQKFTKWLEFKSFEFKSKQTTLSNSEFIEFFVDEPQFHLSMHFYDNDDTIEYEFIFEMENNMFSYNYKNEHVILGEFNKSVAEFLHFITHVINDKIEEKDKEKNQNQVYQVLRIENDDLSDYSKQGFRHILYFCSEFVIVSDDYAEQLHKEIDGILHCFTEIKDGDVTEYDLQNGDIAYLQNG